TAMAIQLRLKFIKTDKIRAFDFYLNQSDRSCSWASTAMIEKMKFSFESADTKASRIIWC
ncbi:MAG: hypothetical protein ACYTX0_50300, partial [Nostoc sp.]